MRARGLLGQSAIEYLMTYGWMLLVVAIVGGAIFSTVNSQGIETSSGFGGSDISVQNFGVTSDNKMQIEIRNTASESVEIGSFRLEMAGELVQNYSGAEIPVGETEVITLDGVSEGGGSESATAVVRYDFGALENLEISGTITGPISFEENASAPLMTLNQDNAGLEFNAVNMSFLSQGSSKGPTYDPDGDGDYDHFVAERRRGQNYVVLSNYDNTTWNKYPCDMFGINHVHNYQNNGELEAVGGYRWTAGRNCNNTGATNIETLRDTDELSRFGNGPLAKADYDSDGEEDEFFYKNGTDNEAYVYDYSSDSIVDNFDFEMVQSTPLDDYNKDGDKDEFLFTKVNRDFLYIFDVSERSYSKVMGIPTQFAYDDRISFASRVGDPLNNGENNQIIGYLSGGGSGRADPYIINIDTYQTYDFGNNSVNGVLGQVGDLGDLDNDGVRDDFIGNYDTTDTFSPNWTMAYVNQN